MKQQLLVLFGGISSEHSVSLVSAAAVLRAINTEKYDVLPVGITQEGEWLYSPAGPDEVENGAWQRHPGCLPAHISASRGGPQLWLEAPGGVQRKEVHLAFPVLHGRWGEDGTLQGLLALAGIPVVGCGCHASALCMDKETAHSLALQAGIPCPAFTTLHRQDGMPEDLAARAVREMAATPFPWFVKPACEGSSYGVSRVQSEAELAAAIAHAFEYDEKVVVEEGISGFEVGCAVMGNDSLTVGEVDAIYLQSGFFDYHEKYNLETAKILLPAPIGPETAQEIKAMTQKLYRLFGCRGFARVDMFLETGGRLVFNEINTIPGLTPHSRFPGMMRAAGLPFEAMIQNLLELAVTT